MMGEYPPLSDNDIAAISLQRLTLESGMSLEDAVITVEHLGFLDS